MKIYGSLDEMDEELGEEYQEKKRAKEDIKARSDEEILQAIKNKKINCPVCGSTQIIWRKNQKKFLCSKCLEDF